MLYSHLQGKALEVHQSKIKELKTYINENTEIKNISIEKINNYIEQLQNKNNSSRTINAKLSYLRHILKYAYRCQWLNYMPFIPTFKIQNKKTKFCSLQEIDLMLNYSNNDEYKVLNQILIIGLNTGLRISNILEIINNIDSIQIENNYLYFYKTKTNTTYTMPLNEAMQQLSKNWKQYNINYRQAVYLFDKMKKELELDSDITLHTLRHTFCSRLVEKGISLPVIQKLMGHKKIETTMLYTHIKNEQMEQAVKALW